MDETMPEPLAARKASSIYRYLSSLSSYPQIPRRRSSLSASLSNGSIGPATSTRTPSLSDSLYQIDVTKLRGKKSGGTHPNRAGSLSSTEDPFIDEVPRSLSDAPRLESLVGYRPGTRLTVRWSSGSWDSGRPTLPSSSASASAETRSPSPSSRQSSFMQMSRGSSISLCPIDLPISFVDVKASASKAQIGLGSASLWTTVQVSADVTPMSFLGTSGLAPLDTIVLLDDVPQSSVNCLAQVVLSCSVLASNLTANHDRIALLHLLKEGEKSCFELLLPLGFHSLDAIRSALNRLSRRQHGARKTDPDYGSIIREAAKMFSYYPRTAFCHIFFISAAPPVQLALPWFDQAIGFHTITPQDRLPVQHMKTHSGWHISYQVDNGETRPKETHFIRKVARVIRQLRAGIRPGAIHSLKLSIVPDGGCHIQSVQDDPRLISLRAGETWVVPVLVSVPAVFQETPLETEQQEPRFDNPLIEDLIARINGVLMDYTEEYTQPILTAHVEHGHSLLPPSNRIHTETHLAVVRG